ncbi:MAG: S8 family serine peptidase [Anaerolineae bacterium]|nr:S8 family serine peptidase [Anaerolineae bacterium]
MAISTLPYSKWIKYVLSLAPAFILLSTLAATIAGSANIEDPQPIPLDTLIGQINAEQWHESGWTGMGQAIGVIDRGFGGIRAYLSEGVEVTLQPATNINDYHTANIETGTQSLRIAHAIAPGSDLYACQYTALDQFIDCIYWMVDSDVRIIVHPTGIPILGATDSATWTREVERVTNLGVLWVNAAGNFGHGYLQDTFTDTNDNGFHEFRASGEDGLTIDLLPNVETHVILAWEDSTDSPSAVDLDLEIYSTDGRRIASSNTVQRPDEIGLGVESAELDEFETVKIQIRRTDSGSTSANLHLFVEYAEIPTAQTWGNVVAPGDGPAVLSVAALRDGSVAPYSSRGPLASGAIKPDIAAPGEISLDGKDAIGTHVSAAVVGGVAALIWQAQSEWSSQQIMDYLLASSVVDDTTNPGRDAVYGFGILRLPEDTNITGPDLPVGGPGLTVRNNGPANLNVRTGDGTDFPVLTVLLSGERAGLMGVSNRDPSWYFIELSNGWEGWVAAALVVVEGDASNLPQITPPNHPATATSLPTLTSVPANPAPTAWVPPTNMPITPTVHLSSLHVVPPTRGG